MRMRENRRRIKASMATALEIESREHLVRHIVATLGKKGVGITDEMIHVTHYGFDDRIDWDEYIIVVDRFGVFGFTDSPCPYLAGQADSISLEQTGTTARQLRSAEVESAYGLNQ